MRSLVFLLLMLCGCPSVSRSSDASIPGFDAGTRPDGPIPGELTLWQLDLPSGFPPQIGEAGILVGPDGTLVAIDLGNTHHDDELRAAIRELNTVWLTPERGYRARAPMEIEWILLTHFHADHVGAFQPLTTGAEPLVITRGVVHRGFVDVGSGLNATEFERVCTGLRGPMAPQSFAMCTAASEAPCLVGTDRFPATSCPGLLMGDLAVAGDIGPSFIDLGGGARLELIGADGFVLQGNTPVAPPEFDVQTFNEENARSIVALVSHGPFRFLFAGDLIGAGRPGQPDIESFVVTTAPQIFGTLGIDLTHANHHGRNTSSNANWVNAAAPIDGRTRSVVAGMNDAYVDAPEQDTVDAWTLNGRLGEGRMFITNRAPAGGSGPGLVEVHARVVMQTVDQGRSYWMEGFAAPAVRR